MAIRINLGVKGNYNPKYGPQFELVAKENGKFYKAIRSRGVTYKGEGDKFHSRKYKNNTSRTGYVTIGRA